MIFFNEKKNQKDFESQNFAHFDNFYSIDNKTEKLFDGLVVDFRPKGRPGRICDSMH